MIRYILEPTGRIASTVSGDGDMVAINTPSNAIYVDSDDVVNMSSYFDFNQHQFIGIGNKPSVHHIFDYNFKEWVDNRTLPDIKEQKWSEIKQQRNKLEFGGFEFEGNIYDSDQVSQGRILGAMLAGQPQTWTTADNIVIDLTVTQLQALYVALQNHVAFAHERGRIARIVLEAAQTIEEINAIQI